MKKASFLITNQCIRENIKIKVILYTEWKVKLKILINFYFKKSLTLLFLKENQKNIVGSVLTIAIYHN